MLTVDKVTDAPGVTATLGTNPNATRRLDVNVTGQQPKPNNILINNGKDQLLTLLKLNQVTKTDLLTAPLQSGSGQVELKIFAIHNQTQSTFWQSLAQKLHLTEKPDEIPPVPLATNPSIGADVLNVNGGVHTQLMGHYPYVVMEDGTKYGIAITVPDGLIGQWENFQGPPNDIEGLFGNFTGKQLTGVIEVGRRKRSIAVVARVDDGEPLAKQQINGLTLSEVYQEMLFGSFKPTRKEQNKQYTFIHERTTVQKPTDVALGEEKKAGSVVQDLIFSIPPEGQIRGDIEDMKGLIEIVVYEVVEKEVTERICRPVRIVTPRDDRFDSFKTLGGGSVRGYQAGETTFGEERRERVNISGVRVEKPIAAFRLVLVGENKSQGLEMREQS